MRIGAGLAAAGAAVVLGCPVAAAAAEGDVREGKVLWDRPYDGDTFALGEPNVKIRIWGIDAPESEQPCFRPSGGKDSCGAESKQALRELVAEQTVRCVEKDESYGRYVSQCTVGGTDIAGEMAARGFAIAYVTYTQIYRPSGKAACEAATGIWSRRFEVPSSYRGRGYPQGHLAAAIPSKAVRGTAFNSAPCWRQSSIPAH